MVETDAQLLERYRTAPEASPRGDRHAPGTKTSLAREILKRRGVHVRINETSAGLFQKVAQSETAEQRRKLTTAREKEFPGVFGEPTEIKKLRRPTKPEKGVPQRFIIVNGRKVFEGTAEFKQRTREPTVREIIEGRTAAEKAEAAEKFRTAFRAPRKAPTREEAKKLFETTIGPLPKEKPRFTDIAKAGKPVIQIERAFQPPKFVPARLTKKEVKERLEARGFPLILGEKVDIEERALLKGLTVIEAGEERARRAVEKIRGERKEGVRFQVGEGIAGVGKAAVIEPAKTIVSLGFAGIQIGKRVITEREAVKKAVREVPSEVKAISIAAALGAQKAARERPAFAVGQAIGFTALFATPAKGIPKARAAKTRVKVGVEALKEERVTAPVTIGEKLKLALGREAEVPKTIAEAQALTRAFEPIRLRALPEAVQVRAIGEPKAAVVRGFEVERGLLADVTEVRPGFRLIETTGIEAKLRVFGREEKGLAKPLKGREFIQIETLPGTPRGLLTTRIKPVIEPGLRGLVRTEEVAPGLVKTTAILVNPLIQVTKQRPGLRFGTRPFRIKEAITRRPSRLAIGAGIAPISLVAGKARLGIVGIGKKAKPTVTPVPKERRKVVPKIVPKLKIVPSVKEKAIIITAQTPKPLVKRKVAPVVISTVTPVTKEVPKKPPPVVPTPKIPIRPKPIPAAGFILGGAERVAKPQKGWEYELYFPNAGWVPGHHKPFRTRNEALRVGAVVSLRTRATRFRVSERKKVVAFQAIRQRLPQLNVLLKNFVKKGGVYFRKKPNTKKTHESAGFGMPTIKTKKRKEKKSGIFGMSGQPKKGLDLKSSKKMKLIIGRRK